MASRRTSPASEALVIEDDGTYCLLESEKGEQRKEKGLFSRRMVKQTEEKLIKSFMEM